MRRTIIIIGVIALVVLSSKTADAAPPPSFNVSQTCGTTLYTAGLTLNTSGSTPSYDFSYSVNGVNGTPTTQTFEDSIYAKIAGFADKLVAACNGQDDLGIFILDTPAAPSGGIFDLIAAVIGYRNSVTPIILESDGTMKYGSSDAQTEITRRETRGMMGQNAKTIAARADGDTFFVFFGSPYEILYIKLEYYKTALGHTYLADNDDLIYLYKYSSCELAQPFTVNEFSPGLVLTVPIYESAKVIMKDKVTYPDGFACKGSSVMSFTKEQRFTYDATTQRYSLTSSKRIPEVGGVTVVNGVWTPTEGNMIQPLGSYVGPIATKKVYLGYEDGARYVFVPKGNNPDGSVSVFDDNGLLVKILVPFGSAGQKGITVTSAVNDGVFYFSVGQKAGGKVKVYSITKDGVQQRGAFSGGTGTTSVTVKFLKLYGGRYGLVTLMKVDGKNVLRVWKYSTVKKVFTQDKKFDLNMIKIRGSAASLK